MTARLALALALGLVAGGAGACPAPSDTLLFHSCWGTARADLVLLPEETPPAPDAARHLLVTGAYTATVTRGDGRPKPVGLFVHGDRIINPNLARMDGILILPRDGPPRLEHRERILFEGRRHDLHDPAQRLAFARAAARAGAQVMQSHLLIIDGTPDVAPQPDAPRARRRVFFSGAEGWGVWQSAGAATLHEATLAVAAALGPRMALNLDMGSFDYCRLSLRGEDALRCGIRGRDETAGLSNLLSLALD